MTDVNPKGSIAKQRELDEWDRVQRHYADSYLPPGSPTWDNLKASDWFRWRDDYRATVKQSSKVTRVKLDRIINATFEQVKGLNGTKGREYAGDDDALANFHRRGADLDLDPLRVWGIFAGKHWDAILSFVRRGEVLSEPIEGRIDDLILYLILLKGLVSESSAAKPEKTDVDYVKAGREYVKAGAELLNRSAAEPGAKKMKDATFDEVTELLNRSREDRAKTAPNFLAQAQRGNEIVREAEYRARKKAELEESIVTPSREDQAKTASLPKVTVDKGTEWRGADGARCGYANCTKPLRIGDEIRGVGASTVHAHHLESGAVEGVTLPLEPS